MYGSNLEKKRLCSLAQSPRSSFLSTEKSIDKDRRSTHAQQTHTLQTHTSNIKHGLTRDRKGVRAR